MRRRAEPGFTLVEVVVAISLVAAVLLGLASAMRTLGATADRLDVHVAQGEEMRALSTFLRTALGTLDSPSEPGSQPARRAPLVGGEGLIEWTGLFPVRYGVGGMHRFRLRVLGEPGVPPALVLEFAPLRPLDEVLPWDLIAPAVRIDGVRGLHARYRDARGEWRSDWADEAALPTLIDVTLDGDGGVWPQLLVAPQAGGGGQPPVRFTVGGGR